MCKLLVPIVATEANLAAKFWGNLFLACIIEGAWDNIKLKVEVSLDDIPTLEGGVWCNETSLNILEPRKTIKK